MAAKIQTHRFWRKELELQFLLSDNHFSLNYNFQMKIPLRKLLHVCNKGLNLKCDFLSLRINLGRIVAFILTGTYLNLNLWKQKTQLTTRANNPAKFMSLKHSAT